MKIKKYATADCETDPFLFNRIPKPFIWGFYDIEGFRYFDKTDDFVEFIKEYEGIIYFHNGGKFDIHFLLDYIESQENIMIINGRIAKIKLGKAEIRDSYLLLPVPLSAYKKDEIDYNKMEATERNKKDNRKEIIDYLEGDCLYLYEILSVQFETYGQKLTLASSAFDFWHKNFNEFKNKPRSSAFFFAEFKPFYYGGRVQCFQKGIIDREFQVYDINSAYPYAMTFKHPYGVEYEILEKLPSENIEQCFINFIGISKGCLPFRDKTGLQFPNDDEIREFHVSGWELKLALDSKLIEIHQIKRVYRFFETIDFTDYVTHFFNLKSELKGKDEAKYLLVKLYLNSLYGKFGQSSLDHKEFIFCENCYIEGYINAGYDFEACITEKYALMSIGIIEEKMHFYNVATAASITGFVRAYLYKQILNCETPIYCDTDSIAGINFKNMVTGNNLGAWNLEGEFEKGAIGGKKLYAFKYKNNKKYKISSKGAKLTEKEIFSIAKGNEILYKNIAPTFSLGKEPIFITRKIKLT